MSAPGERESLLRTEGLRVEFDRGFRRDRLVAVNDVDLDIAPGETLGLVGESGSGKSTIGNAILGLVPVTAGTVRFAGQDITHARGGSRRALTEHIQVVFQNPYSSLNPNRRVGATLAEPLLAHRSLSRREVSSEVGAMLERVGLRAADAERYPAAFSGGQRQRIAVARALMVRPRLVVCDEAVSALDLSTQAQVLNLLRDLQSEFGMAMLFISHDLAVVKYMCHRLVVLYRGTVMERGNAAEIYRAPRDPYTQRLVAASPVPDPAAQRAARQARREAVGNSPA